MLDIIIVEDNREIAMLLCDFLRKENYTVSVAESGEKGLNMGADDYIEKPFDLDILLAKIRGIFKRKKTMNIILSLIKQSIISC